MTLSRFFWSIANNLWLQRNLKASWWLKFQLSCMKPIFLHAMSVCGCSSSQHTCDLQDALNVTPMIATLVGEIRAFFSWITIQYNASTFSPDRQSHANSLTSFPRSIKNCVHGVKFDRIVSLAKSLSTRGFNSAAPWIMLVLRLSFF